MTPGTTHPSTAVRSVKSNSQFQTWQWRTGAFDGNAVLGKGVPLRLPRAGQPALHAAMPCYPGALTETCFPCWEGGWQTGTLQHRNAQGSWAPLGSSHCCSRFVPAAPAPLGFSWPCLQDALLSLRVFSAEFSSCKGVWGCGSSGGSCGRPGCPWHVALSCGTAAEPHAPPPANACPKLSTVE